MSAPQRVLHILSSTMRAGVEMVVMNLYREIDRQKLQFDFIVHNIGQDDLGSEIESMGGKVFRIPLLSEIGMKKFVDTVYGIIAKNGPYIAVHAHTDYQSGFSALAAKKAGIPIRICHAHADTSREHHPVFMAKKMLGRFVVLRNATRFCACSKAAGVSLYGTHAVKKGLVEVIPNGIDLKGFAPISIDTRKALLAECKADTITPVIGFVGRFNPEKNPSFFTELAAEAKKLGLPYRFVMVGTGRLLEELETQSSALLEPLVFLGTRADIPALLQCFSLLVVPSFSEGFCLTAAEAQAAGTPVLASSFVPRDADMGIHLMHFMPLDLGAAAWMKQAQNIIRAAKRPDSGVCVRAVHEKGYDALSNMKTFLRLYGCP